MALERKWPPDWPCKWPQGSGWKSSKRFAGSCHWLTEVAHLGQIARRPKKNTASFARDKNLPLCLKKFHHWVSSYWCGRWTKEPGHRRTRGHSTPTRDPMRVGSWIWKDLLELGTDAKLRQCFSSWKPALECSWNRQSINFLIAAQRQYMVSGTGALLKWFVMLRGKRGSIWELHTTKVGNFSLCNVEWLF